MSRHVIVALALLVPSAASATPAAEGRFFFERGREHYRNARYPDAAEEFLLSYEVAPSPGAMYNAALASLRARHRADGYAFLQAYLLLEDDDDERRQSARARMTELRQELAIVHVESSPPGASIFVDRDERGSFGTTPRDIVVDPGTHSIHVSLRHHVDQRIEVEAVAGELRQTRAQLTPQVGSLRLLGSPEGAVVVVLRDGEEVTRSAIGATLELVVGSYHLRVDEPGFTAFEAEALVRANGEERRTLQAEPIPPPVGQALISTSQGVHARVSIDGNPRGETPARVRGLTVGRHLITLEATGRTSWRGHFEVRAERTTFVSVDLLELP